MRIKTPKLGSLPSIVIRQAIDDLTAVEKSPKFEVDMDVWFEKSLESKKCYVCLAGSVIAQAGNSPLADSIEPENFDLITDRKLTAINSFRIGEIRRGLIEFGYSSTRWEESGLPQDIEVIEYSKKNSAKFKKAMLKLADRLEKAGF